MQRVRAASSLHDLLSSTSDPNIALDVFLPKICESFDLAGNRVTIGCVADPVIVDSSRALLVGLVTSEALINTMKYAFPDGREGRIVVTLHDCKGQLALSISDDGVGCTSDTPQGLGSRICDAIVSQLGGTIGHLSNPGGGHTVEIIFPVVAG